MRFRQCVAAGAAVAVAAGLTVGAWPSEASDVPPDDPELGTLIAGEESYVGGTHVWTDYAYDDRGPNSNLVPGGDATYPDGPGNTADLIQLQLGAGPAGELTVAAVLQTLVEGHDAVIGVGLDTDADPGTGAARVPGERWTNRESLGLEHLVVLGTDGSGQVLTWSDGAWSEAADLDVDVDRERNVVSTTVAALRPGAATWRAVGVAGPQVGGGGSWVDGGGDIFDLAYLRAEDPVNQMIAALPEQVPQLGFVPYQDKDQADVLAGRIGVHRAVAHVTFGTDRDVEPATRQGFNAFLYHARVPGLEGLQNDPLRYDGPYMPYAVWVPANLPPSPPLLVFLHGANQYQNVNLVHFNNPQSLGIPSPYDVPAVVIFPNGRTTGWGTPLAHRDALDAIDDALARSALALDPERVVLSGVSSGGMGTFQIASRYPDRFTGGYSLVGGGTTALENLTNVPFRASNGLLDPLVNVQTWRSSADALDAADTVDYRIVLVHNRSHDGPLAEGNCYYLDLLSRDRVRDPSRVRFTTPAQDEETIALGLQPMGAYWVSELRSRDGGAAGIDVESMARPERVQDGDDIFLVDENLTKTADFCGPHPSLRGGNNWSIEGRAFTVRDRVEPANALTLSVTNLAAATVDVGRAGLDSGQPITLAVTADGPTTLNLVGDWQGLVRVSRDGEEVFRGVVRDGRLPVEIAGAGEYVVTPVGG